MDKANSLSHTKWECKYHVVFIPKCRRRTLYGQLRRHLGEIFRELARQRESHIEEGHLMPDHGHMCWVPDDYIGTKIGSLLRAREVMELLVSMSIPENAQ